MRPLSGLKSVDSIESQPASPIGEAKSDRSPSREEVTSLAIRAEALGMLGGLSTEQGFRLIFRNCLQQIVANQAGVVRADDPESIHQMRIGLRHLRSALRLFAKWVRITPALRQELRWINDALGTARDADVLTYDILPKLFAGCPAEPALQPLMQAAFSIATSNRKLAGAAVDSLRFRQLISELSAWLDAGHWQETTDDQTSSDFSKPLRPRAARMLAKRHKSLLERGRQLQTGTTEERHRIRIAAKNLRNATEFFRSMYSPRSARRYIRRLTALQNSLGALNDAAVADQLLRRIEHDSPELATGAAFARGYLGASALPDGPAIDKIWRKFSKAALC